MCTHSLKGYPDIMHIRHELFNGKIIRVTLAMLTALTYFVTHK